MSMANMSYCRFQNTLLDLKDCYLAITEGEPEDSILSPDEVKAFERLIEVCRDFVKDFDEGHIHIKEDTYD